MEGYIFEDGFVCGRYGHATLGHELLISKSLQLCKRTYVAVGSAQEKGTLRNPFSAETRMGVIKTMFPELSEDRLVVGGINDLSNEFNRNTSWGTYLKKHLMEKFGKFPDVIFYGNESGRSKWFEEDDMLNTYEILVPRGAIPISATEVRGFLTLNDEENWRRYTSEKIHHLYQELRRELMDVSEYKEIYEKVLKSGTMNLETFMKYYSVYEEIDKKRKMEQLQGMKV